MLKSNSMGTLTVTKDSNEHLLDGGAQGQGNVPGPVVATGALMWLEQVRWIHWTMYVEDRQEPGSGYDKFWLEVRDGNTNIVSIMSLPQPPATAAKVIDPRQHPGAAAAERRK
jgi:hypothetical protein